MKIAILYSGGKDSNYALYLASKENEISCLISMISENKESYMFQTPGNEFIKYQAKALEIPIIEYETKGEKELELTDMKLAIKKAIKKYKIEGIVTGAIKSTYQASRVQKICNELNIYCINPLWQIDEFKFLNELIEKKFEINIIGIASYPLEKNWLGKIIEKETAKSLISLHKTYGLSSIGEGGELETFITDAPTFKKKIIIKESKKIMDSENSGILQIKKMRLEKK